MPPTRTRLSSCVTIRLITILSHQDHVTPRSLVFEVSALMSVVGKHNLTFVRSGCRRNQSGGPLRGTGQPPPRPCVPLAAPATAFSSQHFSRVFLAQ